jgi:hypothetical protein
MSNHPEWVTRGKTVRQVINELHSFADQELEVQISVDGGITQRPISLVAKSDGVALLKNCEDSFAEVVETESPGASAEKMLAHAVYEIRVLLASYLGSQNEAAPDVRQAAHLAYAVHNVALGVLNDEAVSLSVAHGAIEAVDKLFGSDFSGSFAGGERGV